VRWVQKNKDLGNSSAKKESRGTGKYDEGIISMKKAPFPSKALHQGQYRLPARREKEGGAFHFFNRGGGNGGHSSEKTRGLRGGVTGGGKRKMMCIERGRKSSPQSTVGKKNRILSEPLEERGSREKSPSKEELSSSSFL